MDFKILSSAVIPGKGLTLDASRALLRHQDFDGKANVSKIEKDEDYVGWTYGSIKM